MDVQIAKLDVSSTPQRDEWQNYVAQAPTATLHHSLAWMDAILKTYSHRPHYLMAYHDAKVVGVFPLFEIRSLLAGTILVSVPYAVYGGAVADDSAIADALLGEAKSIAHHTKSKYVDIRSCQLQWPDLPTIDRYATFVKTLPEKVEEVLGAFPRKARAEARKARDKFKLSVRFEDSQLRTVWNLYSRSMRRLGSPNFPFRFFRSLVNLTPDQHLVSVIYHQDRPVAGLLSFTFRDAVLPYYSGCDEYAANKVGANNYLYLTLMEEAVKLGLRRFDFGRTRIDNAGSYNFKKNQGFVPTPLGYQFYVPDGGAVPNLTPDNKKFAWAQQVWKKLPLPLTRLLGSWLSASIPG